MHGHRLTGAPSVGHMPPILPQSAENPLAWTALVRRRAGGRTQLTNEERNRLIAEVAYLRAEQRGLSSRLELGRSRQGSRFVFGFVAEDVG